MQQNQIYVIQVNTKNEEGLLALPSPGGALLPSEVKYSASLVRGLGYTHLVLGSVLFLLGILGSWVEPETCWAGAGIWCGIATISCGICGILAYHLWYKNYSIKAFLVTSVVCVVISILATIMTIYGLINRYEHYYYLVEEAEKHPWFKPFNQNKEQQLTLSVSANQLVGFILEFILATWSMKIGWKGVQAEEFSSSRRDAMCGDLQSVVSAPQHNGKQVPLAALYQLLQAHPEMLGSKNTNGGIGHPWIPGLDGRPSHQSMDYQERVSRFLSHAIEDHNISFSRSPSVFQGEIQENSPPGPSSVIGGSEGRGSPSGGSSDTLVIAPDPGIEGNHRTVLSESIEKKVPQAESSKTDTIKSKGKLQATRQRPDGEAKAKAPNPKDMTQGKSKKDEEEQKQNIQTLISDEPVESNIAIPKSIEIVSSERSTKDMNNETINSEDKKKGETLSLTEHQDITAICSHQENTQILKEEKAENLSSKSDNTSKDTKKRKKEKRSSSEEKTVENPVPSNTDKEEEKVSFPLENLKENKETEKSHKKSKEKKKKSKEKRSISNERMEDLLSQGDEEQSKAKTKNSEHQELHKSSKNEENTIHGENKTNGSVRTKASEHHESRNSNKNKESNINDEVEARITNECKQNEKVNLTMEINDTTEIIQNEMKSKVNAEVTAKDSNTHLNEKVKKSKKSKRDKELNEKSKKQKEATKNNTLSNQDLKDHNETTTDTNNSNNEVAKSMPDSKLIDDIQFQVIDINPPNEFQDS